MKIKKAVFPVAGYGTRMLPATKAIPKEMITLIDKPLIQYAVEEAIDSGIEQIIFVTGRTKKALEDHFDINVELNKTLWDTGKTKLYEEIKKLSEMVDVIYVRQKEQRGLGHAILCAKEIIRDEPFAVILPDDVILSKKPVMKQLIDNYKEPYENIISLMQISPDMAYKYGIVKIEKERENKLYQLSDMEEKPKYDPMSNFAIIGRYVLGPEIIQILEQNVYKHASGEIQLTDALKKMAKNGKVFGYEFEGKRFDCGDKSGLLEATINFAANDSVLYPQLKKIIGELSL